MLCKFDSIWGKIVATTVLKIVRLLMRCATHTTPKAVTSRGSQKIVNVWSVESGVWRVEVKKTVVARQVSLVYCEQ